MLAAVEAATAVKVVVGAMVDHVAISPTTAVLVHVVTDLAQIALLVKVAVLRVVRDFSV